MQLRWAIVAGLALGIAGAWWLSRDTPAQAQTRQARAEHAAAAAAVDARRDLYRWHDANGVLQITDEPPRGRKYERIARNPQSGIEVHGDRD